MEKVKVFYESPEVEVMNIEAETCFATSPADDWTSPEELESNDGFWY